MRLKTLLVCLTVSDHVDTLLRFAVPLARKHNAHLIGLHTIEALLVYPGIAMHIPDAAFAAFSESQKDEIAAVRAVFEKHTENEAFPREFRLVRAEVDSASDRMVEAARSADLVIMAHEDKEADRYDQRQAHHHVIRKSGRPVITVPLGYDGPEIGNNILLGWNATRESARAAHELLTVANHGASVTILRVGRNSQDELKDSDGIDLAQMLSRHGLKPTLEKRDSTGDSIAGVLNQVAFEKGADLIVTGAFGHSKAYDFVIGATTYALLKESNLPVMFSK